MTDVRAATHLADTVATIARFYPATADPARVAASHIRTAPGSKPPMPIDVLSLRRDAVDALTSWALLVADERDLRPGIAAGDVPALCSFLGAHTDWLSGHEAAADATTELDRIARQLEETARQTKARRVHLPGHCPETAENGQSCGGRLGALIKPGQDVLPGRVQCDTDPAHQWAPHEWRTLGRAMGVQLHEDGVLRFGESLRPAS